MAQSLYTTFHPFSRLPRELRCEIWTYAALEPRNLPLQICLTRCKSTLRVVLCYFYTSAPVPASLHVNRESRREAHTIYTRAFTNGLEPRYTYVNFNIDTIVTDSDYLDEAVPEDRARIRKLRLNIDDSRYFNHDMPKFDMPEMSGLEELDIVAPDHFYPFFYPSNAYEEGPFCGASVRQTLEERGGDIGGWEVPRLRLIEFGLTMEWKPGSTGLPEKIMTPTDFPRPMSVS